MLPIFVESLNKIGVHTHEEVTYLDFEDEPAMKSKLPDVQPPDVQRPDIQLPETDKNNDRIDTGIIIMRKGQNATKKYPCGYCPEGTWTTRIQEHFRTKHSQDSNITRILQCTATEYNKLSTQEEKKHAKEQRGKLEALVLNSSTYRHNLRVLNTNSGKCIPII